MRWRTALVRRRLVGRRRASAAPELLGGPYRPSRRTVAVVGAMSVLGVISALPVAGASATSAALPTTAQSEVIPSFDGVKLRATLTEPTSAGRYPVIVMPASWGSSDLEYSLQAKVFAEAGYVVLAYTTRGFLGSGGTIEIAGPQDVQDVSSMIDWALAHSPADPTRVGVAGVSYGAGIGLLAAGHDPRIRAVVSMSAWTDMNYSLYPNQTRHKESEQLLDLAAGTVGHPGPDYRTLVGDFNRNQNMGTVIAGGAVRSAQTVIGQINAHHPAIFIANAWEDALFAPNQLVTFFNGLTGPKHLELAPGDHGTVEASGLLGFRNTVWDNAHRWFDQYLKGSGTGTGTTALPPLQLVSRTGTAAPETYPNWAAVSTHSVALPLGGGTLGTGTLGPATGGTWTTGIFTGRDTVADGGTVEVSGAVDQIAHIPPLATIADIDRRYGAVWESQPVTAQQSIRGIPHLTLTTTPTSSKGTVISYVYDVGPDGVGRLITFTPYTYLNATPNKPFALQTDLTATAYDVPAGHRIALVVDTKDPLFYDADTPGSMVAFSSPATSVSALTLPLR